MKRLTHTAVALAVGLAVSSHAGETKVAESGWDGALAGSGLVYRTIAPGISYGTLNYEGKPRPIAYHVVKAELDDGSVRLGAIRSQMSENGDMAADTLTNMVSLALNQRPRSRIVAAINADYFDKRVLGGHIQNGDPIVRPNARSAFAIGEDGRPMVSTLKMDIYLRFGETGAWHAVPSLNNCMLNKGMPDTVNMPSAWQRFTLREGVAALAEVTGRAADRIGARIVASPARMACVHNPGNHLLIWSMRNEWTSLMRAGEVVALRTTTTPAAGEAVGGGPRLVREGRVSLEFEAEGWSAVDATRLKAVNPRSAAGISRDGKTVWLIVVEGRKATSPGLDAADLARLLIHLGSWDAINFDGGGSASLYTPDAFIMSQTPPRPIKNALAVFRRE
jgi:hypothetical protein